MAFFYKGHIARSQEVFLVYLRIYIILYRKNFNTILIDHVSMNKYSDRGLRVGQLSRVRGITICNISVNGFRNNAAHQKLAFHSSKTLKWGVFQAQSLSTLSNERTIVPYKVFTLQQKPPGMLYTQIHVALSVIFQAIAFNL